MHLLQQKKMQVMLAAMGNHDNAEWNLSICATNKWLMYN